MLDFIIAVDDPIEWHDKNITENRRHYSSIARFGGNSVTCNAERLGAGVHFNTAVPWEDTVVKYGVIRKDLLCSDLRDWDTLYAAGRLQKPVLTLRADREVVAANLQNQASALTASLLLLPRRFTSQDLCRMVVGLSYLGDIRMGLAEDSKKVERIATSSSSGLEETYLPMLREEAFAGVAGVSQEGDKAWQQDQAANSTCQLIARLPKEVRLRLARQLGMSMEFALGQPENLADAALAHGRHRDLIRSSIASIVASSSRGQAVAGLLMAGPRRSAGYVWQKVKKKFAS